MDKLARAVEPSCLCACAHSITEVCAGEPDVMAIQLLQAHGVTGRGMSVQMAACCNYLQRVGDSQRVEEKRQVTLPARIASSKDAVL